MKDRTISPVFVDERQVQRMANEARAALKDLYERLPPPPEPRTMPVDVETELYWPLGEPSGSPSFGNFGSQRQTGDRLVPLGTCAPTLGGLVEDGCAVFWGAQATRGASGAVGFTGSSPPIGSLSAWVRLGDPGSATTRIVGGYFNAAGTLATMQLYVASDGTPAFSVQTSVGTRSVAGVTSQRMYPGSWHFLCGAYNGTGVALFLDGIDLYSGSFGAYAPLAWSLASAPSWRLGLPGSASSWCGALQDLRMHSTVRTVAWAHEAWRRGFNLLGGAT